MRGLLVLAATAVVYAASWATAADRVALVIGNGDYVNATALPNPANDAAAVSAKLESLGFEVLKGVDLDHDAMEDLLRSYVAAMRSAQLVLFYYSGHGLQVNGKNYLVPVDAALEDETALNFELIDADEVFGYMDGNNRIALAFLDACRNNPLARSLSRSLQRTRSGEVNSGLAAPVTDGTGMFISFATSPGDVALDGEGSNSPFTEAILRHIGTPGLELNQMMIRVKSDVRNATADDQRPWTNSDLSSEVYLVPGVDAAEDAADETLWRLIADSDAPALFEEFLKRYPDSQRSAEASTRLATLLRQERPTPPKTPEKPVEPAGCLPDDLRKSKVLRLKVCVSGVQWNVGEATGAQEFVFYSKDDKIGLAIITETVELEWQPFRDAVIKVAADGAKVDIKSIRVFGERQSTVSGRTWDAMRYQVALAGTLLEFNNYRFTEPGFGTTQIVFWSLPTDAAFATEIAEAIMATVEIDP